MLVFDVRQKYTLKLTYKPPFLDQEELVIGQLWEYQGPGQKKPEWFGFVPKYLPDFDFRLPEDGRDDKQELLDSVKTNARKLVRMGFIPTDAKLFFTMLPVEQCF